MEDLPLLPEIALKGLKSSLNNDLNDKVYLHKARFVRIFTNRFLEMLSNLIIYQTKEEHLKQISIDFVAVERALRLGYHVVLGMNTKDVLVVFGYIIPKNNHLYRINHILQEVVYTKDDITFITQENLPKEFKQITYQGNGKNGNFVVLDNKELALVSDYEIISHFVEVLAEISLSRYSIIMQAKISTVFKGEPKSEDINTIVKRLYEGSPVIRASELFDPEENIINIDNAGIVQHLNDLKIEYQNKLTELNNMLGVSSISIEKLSGISDVEAQSNQSYIINNANIYLSSRSRALKLLYKRYGIDIQPIYNDDVKSEMLNFSKQIDLGGNIHAKNNNDVRLSENGTHQP